MSCSTENKIVRDRATLAGMLAERRAAAPGTKVVFTNGCFDILHAGHARTLSFAKSQGAVLVVGINDDASVARLKGPTRPVLPLVQRLRVVAGFAAADFVIPFSEDTPLELVLALRPDVLVKGGDYRLDEIVGGREVIGWGGRVVSAPTIEGVSTRAVIQTILDRFTKKD